MAYCLYCGEELLPAHRDFGICCWCVKESNEREKRNENMKPPSYSGDDFRDLKEEEILPTAEEYM